MKGKSLTRYPVLLLLFFCISCHHKNRQVVRSYYYWKTSAYVDDTQIKFLKTHSIRKLYAKLMDIDWKEVFGAYPVVSAETEELELQLNRYDSLNIELVPVIFITNKTFQHVKKADISILAKRIVRRCFPAYDSVDMAYEQVNLRYYSYNDLASKRWVPREVQFDCDWTLATAENYFYFLREFRSMLPPGTALSATVRLHQYKYYAKTGIPPVDRGMLMMYNVNDLREHTNINSIFDDTKAKAYFTIDRYPLPLDIVLPAYSWCIVFRNNEFMQLAYGISQQELTEADFLKKEGDGFYRITKDTVFHDLFLRPGDELKMERIDDHTLKEAAKLSLKAINSDSLHVSLFDLTSPETENYSYETIEEIYSSYR